MVLHVISVPHIGVMTSAIKHSLSASLSGSFHPLYSASKRSWKFLFFPFITLLWKITKTIFALLNASHTRWNGSIKILKRTFPLIIFQVLKTERIKKFLVKLIKRHHVLSLKSVTSIYFQNDFMMIRATKLPYYFKFKINLPLSLKPMFKTVKQVSCKDGDCSLNKLRILPLISFIAINLIIATSFGLFCYHNI